MLIGGIEAGGTKMVCTVAELPEQAVKARPEEGEKIALPKIVDRMSIPTEQPKETLGTMIAYFQKWKPAALGIGCFGPVDLNRNSKTYGYITKTPKAGWEDCNIVGAFQQALGVPVGFDTDVNGAVLGEVTWGAARGCDTAIYVTVGTGVGVGVYCNNALVHGLVHPEAGHILLAKHPDDTYGGGCPFHGGCMEGLASGSALGGRWGVPAAELADRPGVWEMEAYYIAQALTNYILCYSPQRIILWGGVMHQEQLFPMVREKVKELLGGYVHHPLIEEETDKYIVPPELGENPGILGAVRLGMMELERSLS